MVVALDLFSTPLRIGCLVVLAAVLVITSGERRRDGSGWWDIMAVGLAVSVVGAVLAQVAETAGGIVAVIGAALILVATTIGFPPGE